MREKILDLLHGKKIDTQPAFSGLIHVTEEGLVSENLKFNEIHTDASKMAKAAASTFKWTGMPSAALPLDLCAPAEMLGAELRYYPDNELQFPQVGKVKFESTKEIPTVTGEVLSRGRNELICKAIELVKRDVGNDIVISGMIPGPFTLLLYVCRPKNVFIELKKDPGSVSNALFRLSAFLAKIAEDYLNSGADFITVHEMGGSPGFIGPKPFESHILPALQKLTSKLHCPTVLSVCGKTDAGLSMLAVSGADAISVDHMTNLGAARELLKNVMLFGNIDPVDTLNQGDEARVVEAVRRAKEADVDAIWPGCDLVVQTPMKMIETMANAETK